MVEYVWMKKATTVLFFQSLCYGRVYMDEWSKEEWPISYSPNPFIRVWLDELSRELKSNWSSILPISLAQQKNE